MRRASTALALVTALGAALALLGCDRPQPWLICHNANCKGPADPDLDDTVEALRESLALEQDGRPLVDGVEVDLFWHGEQARCIFAHDLAGEGEAPDASVAAEEIAAWLEGRAGRPVTHRAERLHVFVELKGHVGLSKLDAHSPEQRAGHVDCALGVRDRLAAAATASGHPVHVVFTSFDPALLGALRSHATWADALGAGALTAGLGVLQGIPKPLDPQSRPLSEFADDLGVELASVHPHWLRQGAYEAMRSRGWDVGFWMFSANAETFDAISRYEPTVVTTSEAELLRGWLDR